MIDWMSRAKAHLASGYGGGTARTDETPLLSVSSALHMREAPERADVSSVLAVGHRGIPAVCKPVVIASPPAIASAVQVEFGAPLTARATGNPHMTPQQGDECHACGWDDTEIENFLVRQRRFARLGRLDAEHLAERLTLRDRQADDRRICLECLELESSGRCAAARRGAMSGVDRSLVPVPDILVRCAWFRPAQPNPRFQPSADDENHQN